MYSKVSKANFQQQACMSPEIIKTCFLYFFFKECPKTFPSEEFRQAAMDTVTPTYNRERK